MCVHRTATLRPSGGESQDCLRTLQSWPTHLHAWWQVKFQGVDKDMNRAMHKPTLRHCDTLNQRLASKSKVLAVLSRSRLY